MTETIKDSILEYWLRYIENASPLIKNWLTKENLYLKKNIKKDSVVLDVGCGFGRSTETVAKSVKKVVGIDNNKEFIKKIKNKLLKFENVEIFFEDAKKMHFSDNTFNYTICMGNTFGDFGKDKLNILKEMKRVTQKGGRVIISVYSENALNTRIKEYKKIGIKINKIQNGTVYTNDGLTLEQFSKEKIKRIFKAVGLHVKIIRLTPLSYLCEAIV